MPGEPSKSGKVILFHKTVDGSQSAHPRFPGWNVQLNWC